MARITDNADLLDPRFRARAGEEPQLILRARHGRSASTDAFVYGRRPKVETVLAARHPRPLGRLARRSLGPAARAVRPPRAGRIGRAGWVARLASGRDDLEQADKASFLDRGASAAHGDPRHARPADAALPPRRTGRGRPHLLRARASPPSPPAPPTPARPRILTEAETALGRGALSVTAKTTLPPSRQPATTTGTPRPTGGRTRITPSRPTLPPPRRQTRAGHAACTSRRATNTTAPGCSTCSTTPPRWRSPAEDHRPRRFRRPRRAATSRPGSSTPRPR